MRRSAVPADRKPAYRRGHAMTLPYRLAGSVASNTTAEVPPRMPQRIHGLTRRELCGTASADEHAAHQCAMLFHASEHRIQARESAVQTFLVDHGRSYDAVTVQQRLNPRDGDPLRGRSCISA